MRNRARRFTARSLRFGAGFMLIVVCLWQGGDADADAIKAAEYTNPTTRYAHGVLGDAIEHETLHISLESGTRISFTLPASAVFEDTAPRLVDLDADGAPEVLAVESHQDNGARLAIYGPEGRIAATPYIGTRFRWLAPLGAADLDGDGRMEIAYVDRPHLAKTLRVWRYENRTLTPLSNYSGVTNHRIGETDIAGGIRNCSGKAERILADSTWRELLALTFDGSGFARRTLGTGTSRAAFNRAMECLEPR